MKYCYGIRARHKAGDSHARPLGGSHGLCETLLYNLLHVITSENLKQKSLRDAHTLSKWQHNHKTVRHTSTPQLSSVCRSVSVGVFATYDAQNKQTD